jgi:pilus assembly protein Flp/PilA
MERLVERFCDDESGAAAIEYGLIASLLAVAIILALTSLGTSLSTKFNGIATSLNSAGH